MILRPDLFMRFLRWKLIHLLPKRDVTIATRDGVLTCSNKDWLIGKYLYVYRSYETETIRLTLDLLASEGHLDPAQDELLLDVGANLGMISIALVKAGRFRRAVAFEPGPESFRLLAKNVAQNGLQSRIVCLPYALGSTAAEANLELSPYNSGDNNIRLSNEVTAFGEDKRTTVRVAVRALDELSMENPSLELNRVSLIWLDIQGHEGFFFRGASELIGRAIPVASEFWPYGIRRSGMTEAEYCAIVEALFSHFFWLSGDSFEKDTITAIAKLFDVYRSPREFGHVVFVNDHQ